MQLMDFSKSDGWEEEKAIEKEDRKQLSQMVSKVIYETWGRKSTS